MAQKLISQLNSISTPLQDSDVLIISRDGTELMKVTYSELLSDVSDEVLNDPNVLKTDDIGSVVQAYNANLLETDDIGITVQAFDAGTAKIDEEQTYTAQQVPMSGTLTDAANISWDADTNGQIVSVTLTAIRNFSAPTNIIQNALYVLVITSGGFTPTFDPAFKWPEAAAPAGLSGVCIFNFIGGAGNTLLSNGYAINVS